MSYPQADLQDKTTRPHLSPPVPGMGRESSPHHPTPLQGVGAGTSGRGMSDPSPKANSHNTPTSPPDPRPATLSTCGMLDATPTDNAVVEEKTHPLKTNNPENNWFTPQPYTYQTIGAIRAVFQNHTLIADEPGLGKTIQALLVKQFKPF